MLKTLALSLCLTLLSHHLLAQCGNCDSVLAELGFHVLTPQEIANNPSLLTQATQVECPCDCEGAKSEPVGKGIKFSGKWGWVSLRTGENYDQLRTSGSFVEGFKFERARKKYVSLAFDLDAPEMSGVVIRVEAAWKPQSFSGTIDREQKGMTSWQINSTTISKEVSVLYKSTKGLVRWFVGAGLGKDRMYIKENTWTDYGDNTKRVTENAIEIYHKNWFTALSAGVMYLNRIELRYKRVGTQWSPSSMWYSMKNKSNLVTVGFRL